MSLSLHARKKISHQHKKEIEVLDEFWVQEMKCLEYTHPCLSLCEAADIEEWEAKLRLIKGDLQELLTFSYEQFWCQIMHEPTILRCIDSFLKHAPRWFDSNSVNIPAGLQPLVDEVHRLVFMTLLRTSTYKESETNFIDCEIFAEIIYEFYIFDVPKLMDLCVLYGEDNRELVTKMVENVLTSQPKYKQDIKESLLTITELFGRLSEEIDVAVTSPCGRPHKLSIQDRRSTINEMSSERLKDTVCYLLDIAVTIRAFLDITGHILAPIFIELQFEQSVALLYENLVPFLQERLMELDLPHNEKTALSMQLAQTSSALVHIVRELMEVHCINPLVECCDPTAKPQLVENYIQIMTALFPNKLFVAALQLSFPLEDDRNIILNKDVDHLVDTARLDYLVDSLKVILQEVEEEHPLHPFSRGLHYRKTAQQADHNLAAALDIETNDAEIYRDKKNSQNELEGACAVRPRTPPQAEIESLIFAVSDVIPDLGQGFVQACLEEYDFDSEAVINALLEGSLPPYLISMDPSLPRRVLTEGEQSSADRWMDLPSQVEGLHIHQGKRDHQVLPLTREEKRRLVDTYDEQEVEENVYDPEGAALLAAGLGNMLEYEDEYDDTYDSTIAAVEPDNKKFVTDERGLHKNRRTEPFIEDPALLRQRAADKRAATRGRGRGGPAPPSRDVVGDRPGHGQSDKVVKDRANKDRNKSMRGNHNRRNLADRKRQKTGFF